MVYKTGKSHNNLVERLPCFPAQSPPALDSKTLLCGRLKSLTLAFNKPLNNAKATHDTNTDQSSSSQERLISLSPNLFFRRTPL